MDDVIRKEVIEKFNLVNDYTENKNIWTGHARVGKAEFPSISEAKEILKSVFGECVAEKEGETPEELKRTLAQWENHHPFQHIHEKGQPLFVKKLDDGKIVVAVLWPWQIREGVASLMLYEGNFMG